MSEEKEATILVTTAVTNGRENTSPRSTLRIPMSEYQRDKVEAQASGREPKYEKADGAELDANDLTKHPTG